MGSRPRLIGKNPDEVAGMIRVPAQREANDRQASDNARGSGVICAAAFIVGLGQNRSSNGRSRTSADGGADRPPLVAAASCDADITHVSPSDRAAACAASLQRYRIAFHR